MALSVVCPTEDAVQAFLDYLVDPMLPAKSLVRDTPTESQQQSVAKQVHSVVLLYNYYHRKQNPQLDFLPFNEFCKLAVILKPTLLAHMKFMQKSDVSELSDVEKPLSLTEKKVMDACDICKCLDVSKNAPNVEGWPISKVAVLLMDGKKENCLLRFSSITEGVWSVVEKDSDLSSSEVTTGTRYAYKKKRATRKPAKDDLNVDDAGFLQVGYSAIKDVSGINQNDVVVLDSYTVYSQSREKAASRFYIMQCSQSINQEAIPVPIKDVIKSLQGPLVRKSSNSWTVTPVVEYFHVLPYSEIISEWLCRETFSNSLQDSRLAEKNTMVQSPEGTESNSSEGMSNGPDGKPSINNESPKQKVNSGSCMLNLSDCFKEPHEMDVGDSLCFPSHKERYQNISNTVHVGTDQGVKNPSVQNYSNGSGSANAAKDAKLDSTIMLISEAGINNVAACDQVYAKETVDEGALVANKSNSKDLKKLQILLASKDKLLSQTALTALIRKRNKLALQHRMIEDEIALCDKKIQTILTGGEDDMELKIESIIEGCNDVSVSTQERICQHREDLYSTPSSKRKRLSEAVLVMQNPCQELDGVCHENNWILPTYRVSQSDGGFQANVTVKGMDFECSSGGNPAVNPREARESAAAQMLASLRKMVNPAQ